MKSNIFEGKTKEEAIEKAKTELKTTESNMIINVIEEKNTLLKKSVKIEIFTYDEIISFIKETLNEIAKIMNISINLEVRREESINVKIFSDNNSILIGKNGRTIAALQLLIRQMIMERINKSLVIVLDVEDYKERRSKSLEYLAKRVAREVKNTKVEAKLDSMNSYERRIIHSILADNKYVYTESSGEEPNRYVVVKPKEV